MPLYRPTELRAFLETHNLSPKRELSQNFLVDGNILKKIVSFSNLSEGDFVIEIGPGPGVLTELLLESGCQVLAVEKDTTLARLLNRLQNEKKALQVYEADILEFDIAPHLPQDKKAKVIANIPYHLTTPIVQKISKLSDQIISASLLVQEEVARKCLAKPGSKDYGFFTLFLQYYSIPQYGFFVPANCFYPIPKVGSALIFLEFQKRYPVANEEQFLSAVRVAFSHRRKMLSSSLKELFSAEKIRAALEACKKPLNCRPEDLSIQEWTLIYTRLIA